MRFFWAGLLAIGLFFNGYPTFAKGHTAVETLAAEQRTRAGEDGTPMPPPYPTPKPSPSPTPKPSPTPRPK